MTFIAADGTIVQDTEAPLPYMRSAMISFNVKGLKPNTIVYPFFDGQSVAAYCRMQVSNTYGSSLLTDASGEISGVFRVPPETFKTGVRMFVVTNNASDPTIQTDCVAITSFTSYGAITYDTGRLASTRAPNITFARATSPREISVERITTVNPSTANFKDPIAQTFFVSGYTNGLFITKIDVYFKSKPTDANIPITLQVRQTVNGNPGDVILPLSTVTLYPKDVNASSDASAPTQFTFTSPLYLKNNEEYAMVLLPAGGREGYELWTAELGQTKLGTNEKIDKQPSAGRLYISSNSVKWTVSETRDMKFTIYKALFGNTSSVLYLKNKKVDYLGVSNASSTIEVGDVIISSTGIGTVTIYDSVHDVAHTEITSGTFAEGASVSVGKVVQGTITALTSSATVTGVDTAFTSDITVGDVLIKTNNGILGTVSSITNDTTLVLTGNSVFALTAGTVYVQDKTATVTLEPYTSGIEGKKIHKISPAISFIEFTDSSLTLEQKIWNSAEENPAAYSVLSKNVQLSPLDEEKTIYSHSYEINDTGLNIDPGNTYGSLMVKATLSTSNTNISPIVDIAKSQVIGYENVIKSNKKTISGTSAIASTSVKAVVGTATAYINQVMPGAVLRDSANKVIGIVANLVDATHMTLEENSAIAVDATNNVLTVDYEATDVLGNSKYHTKYTVLGTGQEADDLVVFLDAMMPSGASVEVYGKFLAPQDATDIKKRPWTRMTESSNRDGMGAGEHMYKLTKNAHDENTSVGGLNSSGVYQYTTGGVTFTQYGTFAVKIVLLSYATQYTPTIHSMRAISLMA